ncbi:MAG: glycosyltransferase family 4 protein [Thermodesulfobacteriota bacterium]
MAKRQLRYLFVGGFAARAGDGSLGGQVYACRTLLASPLSQWVGWTLIDSTMASWPPPSFPRRLLKAVKRVLTFIRRLLSSRYDGALLFTAGGASFLEKGFLAFLASRRGLRVVLAPRSGHLAGDLERSRFLRWYLSFVFKHCDRVLCQGESWKRYFLSLTGLPEDRFVVQKNWIETGPYRDLGRRREKDGLTVLFLGQIERLKGVHDLVEAVSLYRDRLAGVRFVLGGNGSALDEVRARLAKLGLTDRFELPGWVDGDRKRELLDRAEIFVLPSHAEGMPNALLEAMAAGLAVVATRVGGIPDLVSSDEIGRLVPPRDPEALGAVLAELAGRPDLRRRLGQAARRRIQSEHDVRLAWGRLYAVLAGDHV